MLFLTSLFINSFHVNADTQLNINEGITLLAVNGKTINTNSLFSGTSSINIKDGINQILVTYTAELNTGNETELESTQPNVILFKAKDADITLQAPKTKNLRGFREFETKLNWSLTNKEKQRIPFKAFTLKKSGFQLSRDYERELEDFNASNSTAALPKQIILSHQAFNKTFNTETITTAKTTETNKNMAMDMLVYWYDHANTKTRNSFKELIENK
jgi:uncharacterized protein YccT (UPF0319 family)